MNRYFISEADDGQWMLVDTAPEDGWQIVATGDENQMALQLGELERPGLANAPMGPPVTITFLMEGERSRDGRIVKEGATTWNQDALPLPIFYQPVNGEGHRGGVVVGRIDSITRDAAGLVTGRGMLGTQPDAQTAEMMIRSGQMHFVSVDGGEAEAEEVYSDLTDMDMPDTLFTLLEIAGTTICTIPAFARAQIEMDDQTGGIQMPAPSEHVAPLAAGARMAAAPRTFFLNPQLREPTPLTVTDDGRVFGHVALWDTCHTGYPGQCVTPPRSRTSYSYFLKPDGYVTAEGDTIPIGIVTMNTGHAAAREHGRIVSAAEATAWYDTTGNIAAYVSCGDDSHGIWVAGVVNPGLTDDDLARLRASRPSGDWRPVKTNVGMSNEMVGLLAVTSPGFPVPKVLVASGQVQVVTGLPAPWRPLPEDVTDPAARRVVSALMGELRHLNERVAVLEAPALTASAQQRIEQILAEPDLPDADDRGLLAHVRDVFASRAEFGAIPVHHTDTVNGTWDAGAATKSVPSPMSMQQARGMFAYVDTSQGDGGKFPVGAGSLPHHVRAGGAANLNGVRNALARLPQSNIPAAQQGAVRNHLNAHLRDGGGNPGGND